MDHELKLQSDGSVVMNGKRFHIPNVTLEAGIGKGANSVVFRGNNRYIQRTVAADNPNIIPVNDRSRNGTVRNIESYRVNPWIFISPGWILLLGVDHAIVIEIPLPGR